MVSELISYRMTVRQAYNTIADIFLLVLANIGARINLNLIIQTLAF